MRARTSAGVIAALVRAGAGTLLTGDEQAATIKKATMLGARKVIEDILRTDNDGT